MKLIDTIFLFCMCAIVAQAQGTDTVLQIGDSLKVSSERAVEILHDALATDPDSEELLKVRAEAYESLKQYDKAIADYRQLTSLFPDEEIFWYLLGRNYYNNEQFPEALKVLNHAIKLNPKYLPAFHTKIRTLLSLNRNEDALKTSDSTLMIAETATNYFLQGEIYNQLNSRQKAEWSFTKATKIDKDYIEAYIALADIAASANKSMETLMASDAALRIDPDSKEALIARSRGFALTKNYTEAIEDVSYVINLDASNTHALYWRGTYYKETDKPQEAIKDFEQVLKLQPSNWQALMGRADSYVKTGDKEMALADYRKLYTVTSDYPEKENIIRLVNQQIFELNRENHKPELTLIDPQPNGFDIHIPDNLPAMTIKGKIIDESPIGTLTINGQEIPVTATGNTFEFATVVTLDEMQDIQIKVVDVYDNINHLTYHLVKNGTVKPKITLHIPNLVDDCTILLEEDSSGTLYVEGKVTNESIISSIVVDGKAVDFDHNAVNPGFSAIVDISNKSCFSISVTDSFGNSMEQTYTLE